MFFIYIVFFTKAKCIHNKYFICKKVYIFHLYIYTFMNMKLTLFLSSFFNNKKNLFSFACRIPSQACSELGLEGTTAGALRSKWRIARKGNKEFAVSTASLHQIDQISHGMAAHHGQRLLQQSILVHGLLPATAAVSSSGARWGGCAFCRLPLSCTHQAAVSQQHSVTSWLDAKHGSFTLQTWVAHRCKLNPL